MRVIISVLTSAAMLGLVPIAGAQQKSPKNEKDKTPAVRPEGDGCVTRDGRTECVFRRMSLDSALTKRPAIGVQTSSTGTVRDSIGVFISRVTPSGPAEKAGIVEGDRIMSINGVDLRVNSADAGDEYAAQLPIRRLTREVGKLNPGSVATLRVWSGGRVRDVAVTVGRASDLRERGMYGSMFPDGMPGMPGMIMTQPNLDGMRMQLREFPRIRQEDFENLRMHLDGLKDHMQELRLRDGDGFGVLAPSRVRVMRDGEWVDIERTEKAKAEKERTEKERSEKKKRD
jgi:hypothetical protein